jgi:hypothetical protein
MATRQLVLVQLLEDALLDGKLREAHPLGFRTVADVDVIGLAELPDLFYPPLRGVVHMTWLLKR